MKEIEDDEDDEDEEMSGVVPAGTPMLEEGVKPRRWTVQETATFERTGIIPNL